MVIRVLVHLCAKKENADSNEASKDINTQARALLFLDCRIVAIALKIVLNDSVWSLWRLSANSPAPAECMLKCQDE